jgi:endonuclease III
MLAETYGSPQLGNKHDPLDELFFIILSQMTTGPSYERVFDRLKQKVGSWEDLLYVEVADLARWISDAGLSGQKAPRIKAIAHRLKQDFGAVDLQALPDWADNDALAYLVSLPGVGLKPAKCVMLFALNRSVLPVDTHVGRVASRLRLAPGTRISDTFALALERVVPKALRFSFHVNVLQHGRNICRARYPACCQCILRKLCPEGNLGCDRLSCGNRSPSK